MLTPQEEIDQSPQHIQLPLWSDILMAPEPEEPVEVEDTPKKPLIVTFYSFKGGVGRSTALGLVGVVFSFCHRGCNIKISTRQTE